jgi:hypothetical protein
LPDEGIFGFFGKSPLHGCLFAVDNHPNPCFVLPGKTTPERQG